MNNGGDAAEQVVRLSLEGFEVAARFGGEEYRIAFGIGSEAGTKDEGQSKAYQYD